MSKTGLGVLKAIGALAPALLLNAACNDFGPEEPSGSAPTAVISVDPPTAPQTELIIWLDGSGSFDPDSGDVLAYQWILPNDQFLEVREGSLTSAQVRVKMNARLGRQAYFLVVRDLELNADTARIDYPNLPPDISIVAEETDVPFGDANRTVLTFDAGGSQDPDGDLFDQLWIIGPEARFENGTSETDDRIEVSFSGTSPSWIRFEVEDALGATSSDSVLVTVSDIPEQTAYVTHNGRVLVVEVPSGNIVDSIQLPDVGDPEAVAFSPDGSRAVITHAGIQNLAFIIDASVHEIVDSVSVDFGPRYVEFTPDGSEAWVVNTVSSTITVIDPQVGTILDAFTPGPAPASVTFTSDGTTAWVPLAGDTLVIVVDVATRLAIDTVNMRWRPSRTVFSGDGNRAVVMNQLYGYFAVDVTSGAVVREVGLESLLESPMIDVEWITGLERAVIMSDRAAAVVNPYSYTASEPFGYTATGTVAVEVSAGGGGDIRFGRRRLLERFRHFHPGANRTSTAI